MGTCPSEVTIERSADDVWAAVRDFGDLWWYPHVARCVLEGDDRTTWKEGSDLASVERLTAHDDEARTHSYVLVDFIGDSVTTREDGEAYDARQLVGHHSAILSVTPLAGQRSRVTYDVTVDDDAVTAASIGRGYGQAIANLKELLEA
jgi:hypothetical protein